jgi:hypothetical protein
MPLDDISYALIGPSEADTAWIRSLIENPQDVFVNHMAPDEQFPAAREHLALIAAQAGRTKYVIATIRDRNQRPRFEIVRYRAGR